MADTCRRKGAAVEIMHNDVIDRETMAALLTGFDDSHPVDLLIDNAGILIDGDNATLATSRSRIERWP